MMNFYHKLLDLPETETPPDHYGLLGVPRFMDDVKLIHSAVITRNSQLKAWDNSKFYREANALLDEVVAASFILEDPIKKAAYDAELRMRLGIAPPTPVVRLPQRDAAAGQVGPAETAGKAAVNSLPSASRRVRTRTNKTGRDTPPASTDVAPAAPELEDDDERLPRLPPRVSKKSRAKRGTRAAKSSGGSFDIIGNFARLMSDLRGPLLAVAGIGLVALTVWATVPGMQFRTQQTYQGEHGSPRTTRQWLSLVRDHEADLRTGSEESKWADVLHKRVTGGIENFLGPDPAAIPDLFEALADEQSPRLRRIAESVLKKFSAQTKPYPEDLIAGLKSPHPRVVDWARRLQRFSGPETKPTTPSGGGGGGGGFGGGGFG